MSKVPFEEKPTVSEYDEDQREKFPESSFPVTVEGSDDLFNEEDLLKRIEELQNMCDTLKQMKTVMAQELDDSRTVKAEKQLLETKLLHFQQNMEKRIPVLLFHSNEVHYPPVTFVMTNFSERWQSRIPWFSPSFYTHPEGYKLCVRVATNGKYSIKSTHVSAHVHIMRGEHDDKLSWPFKGIVELELLNRQADVKHIAFSADFKNPVNMESNKRVHSSSRTDSGFVAWDGEGTDQLIEHSELGFDPVNQTEFLKDNSLFFRITGIKTPSLEQSATPTSDPLQASPALKPVLEFKFKFSKQKGKWESPSFYTHPGGYRFLMVVQANGEYDYKGKYVAIFMHLMKGDYDDNLKWPFRGTFYVQAVNQMEDKNHVEYPVKFSEENDPTGKHGARVKPRSRENIFFGRSLDGWGRASFLRHDLLPYNEHHNTKYLTDNNEIVFRITKVEVFSK